MSTQNEADLRTVVGLLNGQLVATRKVLERLKAEPAGADHEREARMIAQIESALAVRAEPVAPTPPPPTPDRFPLQYHGGGVKPPPGGLWIPWALAEEAYAVYASRYGTSQSLVRLAERGGFGVGEMDMFLPDWRDRVEENARLRAAAWRVLDTTTQETPCAGWVDARGELVRLLGTRPPPVPCRCPNDRHKPRENLEERIAATISLLAHTGQDACNGDHANVVALLRGEPVKYVPERTVADLDRERQERADEQAWRASVDKSLRILSRASSLTMQERELLLERHRSKS